MHRVQECPQKNQPCAKPYNRGPGPKHIKTYTVQNHPVQGLTVAGQFSGYLHSQFTYTHAALFCKIFKSCWMMASVCCCYPISITLELDSGGYCFCILMRPFCGQGQTSQLHIQQQQHRGDDKGSRKFSIFHFCPLFLEWLQAKTNML